MTKTGRSRRSFVRVAPLVALLVISRVDLVAAAQLDTKGELQLGLRTYTAVRIATEETDATIVSDGQRQVARSVTFPLSSSFSLRQHRIFAEIELRHDLMRLYKEGFGPLSLLHHLPFKLRQLRYFISYRGEFEGIYDYGPSEFRTAEQWRNPNIVPDTPFPDISPTRDEIAYRDRTRLRDIGTVRNRLFQAYVQTKVGKVTLRLGRQILAWGETDVFRLLDNINPLDASFGGFLVSLDERRVPLDMLRVDWYLGDFSRTGIPGLSILSKILPFYEAYLEGFVSIDDKVGYSPGVPKGSAWGPPNVNAPTLSILTDYYTPDRNIHDARWGFNFRFSTPFPGVGDMALGIAHYYTYFDIPAVRVLSEANGGQAFPAPISTPGSPAERFSIWAQQTAPQVSVTGVFGNFAIPPEWVRPFGISGEPIIRFETAYFRNEPRNSQTQLDPFIHAFGFNNGCNNPDNPNNPAYRVDAGGNPDPDGTYCTAGARTGDSWNVVLGLDLQQWVRFINPNSSLFITTQFFYKHLNGAIKREPVPYPNPYLPGQQTIYRGEVLPVQKQVISSDIYVPLPADAAVPNFVHSPQDQFLQTLLIMSPYYGGRVLPSLTLVYDWHGAWVFQPSLTYSVDPFRFTVTYNFLTATDLQGGNGISLLRDRDNILFQFEYVI